jgi:hypothetical protein
MQNSKPENNIVSQFVDSSVIKAMKAIFADGQDKIPADEAMVIAEQFGADSSFRTVLEASEVTAAEKKLISSFNSNLNLLVQKTWVEKDDQALKDQVLYKLEGLCKEFENDNYGASYNVLVQLLRDVVYLMFGTQTNSGEFLEYAFRIDPGFGIFWWYVESLPSERPAAEAVAKVYLLLSMIFLSNY